MLCPVSAYQGRCEGAQHCTTQLPNTHNTTERKVLYCHHPWGGHDVCIEGVVEKSGISFARCRLTGDVPCLPLELPLWMFDRVACSAIRHRDFPEVDLASLLALQLLLAEITDSTTSDHQVPSITPDLSADLMSHHKNQGDDHAQITHKASPTGPVRITAGQQSDCDTEMAKLANTGTSQDHGPDGAIADGARHKSPGQRRRRSTPEQGER
jgi:hypothetical protein